MPRYIDADALINELKILKDFWGYTFTAEGVDKAIEKVEEAPTVEAVVFPCKIGDTIYRVCSPSGTRQQPHIKRYKVSRVNFCKAIEDYGTLVFPTEKEARKAVKGAVKAKQNAERVANGREKAD